MQVVVRIRPAVEQPSFTLSIKRWPVLVRNPEYFHMNMARNGREMMLADKAGESFYETES